MVQRFDVGPRLSEMAVHNGICWLAGPDGLGHWMNARGLDFYGAEGLPTAAATVVQGLLVAAWFETGRWKTARV